MSLWVCAEHGPYGPAVGCPTCGVWGELAKSLPASLLREADEIEANFWETDVPAGTGIDFWLKPEAAE